MIDSKNRAPVLTFAVFVIGLGLMFPLAAAADQDVDVIVIDKYGDPIRNAEVTFINASDDDDTWQDDTNSDGIASFGLPEDADYDIEVVKSDYETYEENDIIEDLDEDLDGEDSIMVLLRPAKVEILVHVVDEDGDDLDEVDVEIESLDEDRDAEDLDWEDYDVEYDRFRYSEDDETDSDGEVRFEDLESDTEYNITVRANGYITVSEVVMPDLGEDLDGSDTVEIVLERPGDAIFRVKVKDDDTNEPIQNARVVVVNRDTLEQEVLDTNADGLAEFTLNTPQCYDVLIRKERYSEASQTNLCFNNNDDETIVYTIEAQNNPPIADAGDDLYILEGSTVNLDASDSSDIDGDGLTYIWIDSLGANIPSGVTPTVEFTTPGVHEITLTVSDGNLSDTDIVIVNVETLDNCGNGICSAAENNSMTCPEDCPVCLDNTCGIGEDDSFSSSYCPVDCGIRVIVELRNTTKIVPGNVSTIVSLDENTGSPVPLASLTINTPNGTMSILRTNELGETIYLFQEGGNYTIGVSKDRYVSSDFTVIVESPSDLGNIVTWIIIIVVVILVVLFLIRIKNTQGGGAKGYRARRFKRRKPTLSSL